MTTRMFLAVPKHWAFASLLVVGFCGLAQAGLLEDDEARRAILDLRQKLEASNNSIKALDEQNAQLRRALLDLQGQIDGVKADQSKGRGQFEQLARDLSELQQRHKDVQVGLDERLRRFEPIKATVDGREVMVDQTEKRDYEQALDVFRKGDFGAARNVLMGFVQRYGQSAYLPSALFWLGNAEYATKDYKESMAHFRQLLALAPTHPRAAEAMLAVSNVQQELKDAKGARKTLEDLLLTYPGTETAATAKDRLARLR